MRTQLIYLALVYLLVACAQDGIPVAATSGNGHCLESAARTYAVPMMRQDAMVLIPVGCRNFTWPGHPAEPGYEYLCVSSFWMDTVETTIPAARSVLGAVEARFHSSKPTDLTYCPRCPMDNLTYFEAILLANARTKAELTPQDTVYSYQSIVRTATKAVDVLPTKPTEISNLVGLRADTTKAGFRLPSRAQFAWASLQNSRDTLEYSTTPSALYQWISAATTGETTHPVGLLLPNPFGLYDTEGNVWEWTSQIDSVDLGAGIPNWEIYHVALGGGIFWRASSEVDTRIGDLDHAGVRFVRNSAGGSSTSVLPHPCLK